MPPGAGLPCVCRQQPECLQPVLGELPYVLGRQQPVRPCPRRVQFRPGSCLVHQGIDREHVCHGTPAVVVDALDPEGGIECPAFGTRRGSGGPPQVVEAELGHGQRGQLPGGAVVEVAQQAEAQPLAGDASQLLLDTMQGPAEFRVVAVQVLPAGYTGIQMCRVEAGEPSDGTRDVDAVAHLLPAMALKVHEQSSARGLAAAPPPSLDGQRQPGEENLVGAGVERLGRLREQGAGVLGGQRDGQGPGAAQYIEARVEGAVAEQRVRAAEGVPPVGEFGGPLPCRGLVGQTPGPGSVRAAVRARPRCLAPLVRPGGSDEILHQNAPGHTVDDEVMHDQQQLSGPGGTVVQQYGAHHRAISR
ncbi:hypothetical protein EES40_21585 [Streptomyces sp. ADI93-02]|nr:hypothetical protein EES40_21585 [Streptomyces sp. ADI93-02]